MHTVWTWPTLVQSSYPSCKCTPCGPDPPWCRALTHPVKCTPCGLDLPSCSALVPCGPVLFWVQQGPWRCHPFYSQHCPGPVSDASPLSGAAAQGHGHSSCSAHTTETASFFRPSKLQQGNLPSIRKIYFLLTSDSFKGIENTTLVVVLIILETGALKSWHLTKWELLPCLMFICWHKNQQQSMSDNCAL